MTIDRVLAEYAKLAFLDIRKAFDEDGNLVPIHEMDDDTAAAITGLEVEEVRATVEVDEGLEAQPHGGALRRSRERQTVGRLKKVKLSDKKGALDSLAKYLGLFSDANVNVNVGTQPLPEQDKAMLAEYAKAD